MAEAFAEEQPRLLPLPAHPFNTDLVRPVRSAKTIYVRFDLNDYSIPPEAVRRQLTFVASDPLVRILDGNQQIACHRRSYDRHQPVLDSSPASYVPTVLALHLSLPETPIRTNALDHCQARLLQQRAVPLRVVESAFLLASLRRLIRPKDVPPLSPIRSLAYFLPAVEELLADPLPDNYLDYLRLKLNRILHSKGEDTYPASADVQKTTFSDDR